MEGLAEGAPVLHLHLADKSFLGNYKLKPGKYQIRLEITASNAEPLVRELVFSLDDHWYSSVEEMSAKGLTFEPLSTGGAC